MTVKGRKKKREFKLFVWEDVLSDYTSGIAFAYARNEEEAWKLVSRELCESVDETKRRGWNKPIVYETGIGFAVYGGG